MENLGIDPSTSRMQSGRSTPERSPTNDLYTIPYTKSSSFHIRVFYQRNMVKVPLNYRKRKIIVEYQIIWIFRLYIET